MRRRRISIRVKEREKKIRLEEEIAGVGKTTKFQLPSHPSTLIRAKD